jgi:hypothetical protein
MEEESFEENFPGKIKKGKASLSKKFRPILNFKTVIL